MTVDRSLKKLSIETITRSLGGRGFVTVLSYLWLTGFVYDRVTSNVCQRLKWLYTGELCGVLSVCTRSIHAFTR